MSFEIVTNIPDTKMGSFNKTITVSGKFQIRLDEHTDITHAVNLFNFTTILNRRYGILYACLFLNVLF